MVDVYAGRLHVAAHDQRGLGKTSIPPGPVHDGRLRGRRHRPHRPPRLGHVPGGRHQLRRDGRPGDGRHRARPHRAPRPELHVARAASAARRTRCTSCATSPPRRPGRSAMTLLDSRFDEEWLADPRPRPDARRGHGQPLGRRAGQRAGARRARADGGPQGPRRLGPPAPHHLPDARGVGPLRRHRPAGQRRGHRLADPERRASGSTRAATPSSPRTPRRSRRSSPSSPPDRPPRGAPARPQIAAEGGSARVGFRHVVSHLRGKS